MKLSGLIMTCKLHSGFPWQPLKKKKSHSLRYSAFFFLALEIFQQVMGVKTSVVQDEYQTQPLEMNLVFSNVIIIVSKQIECVLQSTYELSPRLSVFRVRSFSASNGYIMYLNQNHATP